MQTTHELQENTLKVQLNNDKTPVFIQNKHYNSATSVSSVDYSRRKQEVEQPEIDLNHTDFISNFISSKNEAFEPLNTQNSQDSINYKENNKKASIKKWYILLNVVLPVVHLRKIKAHILSVQTLDYLTNQCKQHQNPLLNSKNEKELPKESSLDYIKHQIKLYEYIENGFESAIDDIQNLLKKNTKLINDYNYNKITPLYAACMNGHKKIVELLINNKANHLLRCNDESVLDVAIRFSYVDIVRLLLDKCEWPKDYIQKSRNKVKNHKNKTIKEMVLNKKKKRNQFINCFCFS